MPPKGWRKGDTKMTETQEISGVPADLSTLPQALLDYFLAQGSVCTLDSSHPNQVSLNSLRQRYPLTVDDLPADEAERASLIKLLKRSACIARADGTFTRGDCYIYVQSVAAREQMLADGRAAWLQQDPDETAEAAASGMNEMIGDLSRLGIGVVKTTTKGGVFTIPSNR